MNTHNRRPSDFAVHGPGLPDPGHLRWISNRASWAVLASAALAGLLFLATTLPGAAHACGWWGDGEMNRDDDSVVTGMDGRPVPGTLSPDTTKLRGRAGYGIAVTKPDRALPYLQATFGRRIRRIGEFKAFGFMTVIDLGTSADTARLHRAETEAAGLRYVNVPIVGVMPNEAEIKRFSLEIVRHSRDLLLVYSPTSALLGTMWASHRIDLGAPLEFAVAEGKALGMRPSEESQVRTRHKRREEPPVWGASE